MHKFYFSLYKPLQIIIFKFENYDLFRIKSEKILSLNKLFLNKISVFIKKYII